MLVLRVIILFLMCSNITGQSYQNLARLKLNLLQNYIKSNRPLRYQNETLMVYIDVHIRMVEEFNIMEGVLVTHLTFTLQWTDEFIRWDSEEYDNITVINLPHLDVWVPQMVLLNPADNSGFLINEKDMRIVQYTSEGLASLTFANYLESMCQPFLQYYPFDYHSCHLMISHIGYSMVDVISVPLNVDAGQVNKGHWYIGAINLTDNLLIPGVNSSKYVDLSIQLSRRPALLLWTLFFPVFIQMFINMLVFYIPAESGEKASYSITVFLAVEIFMTIIMDKLPSVSSAIPIVNVILAMHLVNTALLCTMTVASLHFHHRSNTIQIPVSYQRFTIRMSRTFGDILKNRPLENMSQMAERENRDITETGDITHHAAVSAEIDGAFLTWQSVGRALDYFSLYICAFMTGYLVFVFLFLALFYYF